MKPIIPFALLGALLAVGAANAAVTDPVGYVSLGDTTVGQPAVKANTDVHVSIPLLRPAAFAGAVSAAGTNTLDITGAAFTVNQWVGVEPYVVVIESGPKSGLILPILSNTATQLTVDPGTFSLAGVVATNQLSIRKAWTVSSFMAGASSLNGVILFAFSNIATGINVSSDILYVYNGTSWEDGDGNPANNTILFPGEGFIVRTSATPIATFSVNGDVPTQKHFVQVGTNAAGPRDSFLSFISPVSEALSVSGAGFGTGDIVFTFNNAAAGQNKSGTPYFYTGAGWEDGDGNPADSFGLVGGTAFLYRRATAAPTGLTDWQNEQTYIPGL